MSGLNWQINPLVVFMFMAIRLRRSLGFHPEPSEKYSARIFWFPHDASGWEYE